MKKNKKEIVSNFWPSYTDVLISIVFILLIFYFVMVIRVHNQQLINLNEVRNCVMNDIRESLGNDTNIIDRDTLIGTNHTILFKDSFLFEQGKDEFIRGSRSEQLIRNIGKVLVKYVRDSTIYRIVVEGHTNSDAYKNDPYGNWGLSSQRAVRVVRIFDEIGILKIFGDGDRRPSRLLSVAGYSQYDYVPNNSNRENKESSKRIQISLEYRYK